VLQARDNLYEQWMPGWQALTVQWETGVHGRHHYSTAHIHLLLPVVTAACFIHFHTLTSFECTKQTDKDER
jgi:hypothetical protein